MSATVDEKVDQLRADLAARALGVVDENKTTEGK
jgi:hypothetical protein